MKCLIAVLPSGGACFISDLYEGSADDVKMFSECGIIRHINPGDAAMVNKGFTVQELLQATVFIPPFLGNRSKFSKEEVVLLKRIAKARIHVERFKERLYHPLESCPYCFTNGVRCLLPCKFSGYSL